MKKNRDFPIITERLKRLRKHLDYSQSEMAGRVGVSASAYSKYELGIRSPSFTTLTRMVKEFNISMDWLYFDKGPMFYRDAGQLPPLEQENKQQKEQLAQLGQQLEAKESQLKRKDEELSNQPKMSPEVKQLVEQMARFPVLNHEILAHFHRFTHQRTDQPRVEPEE